MKVCFLMRSEFAQVHGGDVVQVLKYCDYLESRGVQCELHGRYPGPSFDFYFIVNIDRPIELKEYYTRLVFDSKNYFVIPIHHPIEAVNLYEKKIRGGFFGLLARCVPSFYSREKIKNFFRVYNRKWYIQLVFKNLFVDYKQMTRSVLEGAGCVFCIAQAEDRSIRNEFNAEYDVKIVRNGVSSSESLSVGGSSIEFDVLVVGRIEERKNQASVVQALSDSGLKVGFIGALSDPCSNYQRSFLSSIASNSNFDYLGVLPQSELFQYYSKSRLLINCSFFEVSPLVDVEAAIAGCRIITTKHGYTVESVLDARTVDPYCLKSIEDACERELELWPVSNTLDVEALDWNVTGAEIYRVLVDCRG